MTRLSALDASFLRVESDAAHMHIGWVAMLGLRSGQERLDVGLLSRRLKARLHLAPRFRQVVAAPPGGMALPRWVDDQDFALDQHLTVQRSATPLRRSSTSSSPRRFRAIVRSGRSTWCPACRDGALR